MKHIDRIDLAAPVQDMPPLTESYDDPAVAEVRVVEGDEMFTSQDYTELGLYIHMGHTPYLGLVSWLTNFLEELFIDSRKLTH